MSFKNLGTVCLVLALTGFVATKAQAGEPPWTTVTAPPGTKMVFLPTFTGMQKTSNEAVPANCPKGDSTTIRQNVRDQDGKVTQYVVSVDAKISSVNDVYLACEGEGGREQYPVRVQCLSQGDLVYRLHVPGRSGKFFVCSHSAPKMKASASRAPSVVQDDESEPELEQAPSSAN